MSEVTHAAMKKLQNILNFLYLAAVGQNGSAKDFCQTVALFSVVTVLVMNNPAFVPIGKLQLYFQPKAYHTLKLKHTHTHTPLSMLLSLQ